jgi:hypothetical protein
MKKALFAIVAVFATVVCVSVYANTSHVETANCEEVHVHTTAEGRGACTMKGCKCQKFVQRKGYYQCVCGHQSFVHK